jgi:hypothetical protein
MFTETQTAADDLAPVANANFFFAGHAIWTVAGPHGRFTFRARRPKQTSPQIPPLFLGVLTGPDNTASYTYAGVLRQDGTVAITKKSKYDAGSVPVKVATWAIRQVMQGKALPDGYTIHHAGRCCRCGRLLTTPESVIQGMGPECASKMGG